MKKKVKNSLYRKITYQQFKIAFLKKKKVEKLLYTFLSRLVFCLLVRRVLSWSLSPLLGIGLDLTVLSHQFYGIELNGRNFSQVFLSNFYLEIYS